MSFGFEVLQGSPTTLFHSELFQASISVLLHSEGSQEQA